MAFKYSEDRCDVLDRVSLARFRSKMLNWRQMMSEDEQSVIQQIYRMMWDDAVFRTLNEARRLAASSKSKEIGLNSPLLGLIDRGYVAYQTVAIRRITADEGDSNTIIRVAKDIKNNSALFTREILVSHDGLPFDPAPLQEIWHRNQFARGGGVWVESLELEGPTAWSGSELAHQRFDRLFGKTVSSPARSDRLDVEGLLDFQLKNLEICRDIRKYANKFIAHAADFKSRSKLTDDERKVTLGKIRECHKVICEVANYIFCTLLDIAHTSFIATPQYDQFENLHKPMIVESDAENLKEFWDKNAKEIEAWS